MLKVINYLGSKLGSGGIESFVTNVSAGMHENQVDYIVCVDYKTENIYESRLLAAGATIKYLAPTKPSYIKKTIHFIKYIAQNRDAIVYFHASTAGMYLHAFLAKLVGVKQIVYHVHSTPNPANKTWKKEKDVLLDVLFSKVPRIRVACSNEAGKQFYHQAYTVVHNGIDVERFSFSEIERLEMREKLCVNDEFLILQVGRLSYPKNQMFSLQVLHQCIAANLKVKMLLLGDGADEMMLKSYIKQENLQNDVRILKPDSAVEKYYMAADLMLFPSVYEGLGIVAIEAQAAGLPILCSEHILQDVFLTNFISASSLQNMNDWLQQIKSKAREISSRKNLSIIGKNSCYANGYSIENAREELIEIYSLCAQYANNEVR